MHRRPYGANGKMYGEMTDAAAKKSATMDLLDMLKAEMKPATEAGCMAAYGRSPQSDGDAASG